MFPICQNQIFGSKSGSQRSGKVYYILAPVCSEKLASCERAKTKRMIYELYHNTKTPDFRILTNNSLTKKVGLLGHQ